MGSPQTAEILLETPEVSVEQAEDGEEKVSLSGTMFHEGLNANAWGMTQRGANAIASSIEGADLTAGHPRVHGYGFTRSIHEGPGKPIGEVSTTEVVEVEGATMEDVGGHYSAYYESEVLSKTYADDFRDGLMIGGDYGVSVGIVASDEDAICSVCSSNFAECKHVRGEEVEGQVAGPLYDDGEADHLAVVYVPAYENADIENVSGTAAASDTMLATTADEFFGQPYDNKAPQTQEAEDGVEESGNGSTDADDSIDGTPVRVEKEPTFNVQL